MGDGPVKASGRGCYSGKNLSMAFTAADSRARADAVKKVCPGGNANVTTLGRERTIEGNQVCATLEVEVTCVDPSLAAAPPAAVKEKPSEPEAKIPSREEVKKGLPDMELNPDPGVVSFAKDARAAIARLKKGEPSTKDDIEKRAAAAFDELDF